MYTVYTYVSRYNYYFFLSFFIYHVKYHIFYICSYIIFHLRATNVCYGSYSGSYKSWKQPLLSSVKPSFLRSQIPKTHSQEKVFIYSSNLNVNKSSYQHFWVFFSYYKSTLKDLYLASINFLISFILLKIQRFNVCSSFHIIQSIYFRKNI